MLARPGDGEAFFVEQFLDAQNAFNILAPIHPLPGAAFNRLQLRELRFPKSQHIGWQLTKRGDFPNAEVQPLGNFHFRVFFGFAHRFSKPLRFLNCNSFSSRMRSSSRFYHYAAPETTGFFNSTPSFLLQMKTPLEELHPARGLKLNIRVGISFSASFS